MFPELLRDRLASIVELSPKQVELLERHYERMVRWNRVLNLTSIDRLEEVVERHYCESLFLARRLPESGGKIVDIGSGAGFPGFPVAVLRPECSVALIESHQRKAVFLKESAREVSNCRVIAKRAEEVMERFDWAISRAVSYRDLGKLSRLADRAMLLTGAEEPPRGLGFQWQSPTPLPWGKGRFLRISSEVACFT
ncbi:MAG TPA: 16S rRNA (guanine(527)-N(7))-methyltransferase RsmG [Bryobacteraceae bacterium]|nr:16S rRNA (guanine(527)-N(7))-methyltransferase RsmG [Bryobacteraceae bacterium]